MKVKYVNLFGKRFTVYHDSDYFSIKETNVQTEIIRILVSAILVAGTLLYAVKMLLPFLL